MRDANDETEARFFWRWIVTKACCRLEMVVDDTMPRRLAVAARKDMPRTELLNKNIVKQLQI